MQLCILLYILCTYQNAFHLTRFARAITNSLLNSKIKITKEIVEREKNAVFVSLFCPVLRLFGAACAL